MNPDDVTPDADEPDVTRPGPAGPEAAEPGPTGPDAESTGTATPAARHRRGALVVRTLSAAGVLALAAAVVGAGTVRPPLALVDVPAVQIHVPAPATRLVCPGPLRLATEPEPGGDVVYDPQFDPSPGESVAVLRAVTAAPTVVGTQDDAPVTEDAATGDLSPLGRPDETLAELQGGSGGGVAALSQLGQGVVVGASPAGDAPAWVAGSVGVTTAQGDLRGFAAASCQEPVPDSWLVGGSTELGSSARLVLQNPGLTAATVQVELWGPAGAVELAGSPEYLVPAGSERVVLLEGVAAEQRRIVVHVVASGGLVAAYLQDSQLRGLVPAGVDYVVAGQAPAVQQVVTGLSVTPSEPDGVDLAVLRLLAPQDGGVARVTFLGADGVVALPGTDSIALEAGAVLDVPLGGLPAGAYTAVVDADVPVVAGALVTRGQLVGLSGVTPGQAPIDRAWAPSSQLGMSGPLALPSGLRGRLMVAAVDDATISGPAPITLEMLGADGALLARRELSVPVGRTLALLFGDLLAAGTTPDGDVATTASEDPPEVAAVVLRTSDPRVAWGAILGVQVGSVAGDAFVSVLTPVAPARRQPEVGVTLR